jgi:hypothetical protein
VNQDSSREQFLAALLEEWTEASTAPGGTSSWALLREGFVSLAPALRAWLLANVGAGKGGAVGALFIDTAQILPAVRSAYRCIFAGAFGDEFEANWNRKLYGPVIDMGLRAGKHLSPALRQEADRCGKWLATLDSACGKQTAAALGESLKLALTKGTEASVFNNTLLADVALLCENFVNGIYAPHRRRSLRPASAPCPARPASAFSGNLYPTLGFWATLRPGGKVSAPGPQFPGTNPANAGLRDH